MRTIVFTCCFLLSIAGFSQNWQLFDPAREYYFGQPSFDVKEALRFDSTRAAGADVLHFLARRFWVDFGSGDTCHPVMERDCRFGNYIRAYPNGDCHFVYRNGDSLLMKRKPTQPWTVFTNSGSGFPALIIGEPQSTQVISVLGMQDSVIPIRLRFEYPAGTFYTYRDFCLTKSFGPLMALDYTLPLSNSYDTLLGISQPNLGITNSPKEAFFAMLPGDTIQIHYEYYNGGVESWHFVWTQDIYLNRFHSSMGDTIFLEVDRSIAESFDFSRVVTASSHQTVIDTIPIQSSAYRRLDRDLGEISALEYDQSAWSNAWRINASMGNRLMKSMDLRDGYDTLDSCFNHPFRLLDNFERYYLDGMGGPYFWGESWPPQFEYHKYRYPSFANLGGMRIGTFIDFDTLLLVNPPSIPIPVFAIWPNPVTTTLHIDLSPLLGQGMAEIILLNPHGQTVAQVRVPTGQLHLLDLTAQPCGLYVLRCQTARGFTTQRIVLR